MYRAIFTILFFLVSVIGTNVFAYDMAIQTTIHAGNVSYMAVDGKTETVALVSKEDQSLSIVNTRIGVITNTVPLAAQPSAVAIQDCKIIVSSTSGQIYIFDTAGMITGMVNTYAPILSIVAYGHDAVAVVFDDSVKVVNLADGTSEEIVPVTGANPIISSSPGYLVLSEFMDGGTRLSVTDKKTGAGIETSIPGNVTSLAIDESLKYILVTMVGKTCIQILDISTLVSVGEIETNRLISNLSVNPSTHIAVMSSLADGNIVAVNLDTKLIEKAYPLFESISATLVDSASNLALAALGKTVALVKLENPVPVLDSIIPESVIAGSEGFPLSVFGSRFIRDTQAWFNKKPVNTLYDTDKQLKADILPDELIYPGDVTVSAVNPPPGGGESNPLTFRIQTPIPQIVRLNPDIIEIGKTGVIRVEGKNFLPNAKALVNGIKVETYFVSSIALSAKVDASGIIESGLVKITVVNTGATSSGPVSATSNALYLKLAPAAEVAAASEAAQILTQAAFLKTGSLKGRILNTHKEPVENVTISYKGVSTKTDAKGNFVLNGVPEGRRTILVDGSTAIDRIGYYPTIPVTVEITGNTVNPMNYTPHLHRQKNHNYVQIKSGEDTIVTDPELKGFSMKIPKGVRIIGWDGKPNTKVSVRTVPPDRLPIKPLPENTHIRTVMMFFFDKVGGGRPDQPIPFRSPNNLGLLPGERATLWYYDESSADNEAPNDWAIAGFGTVTPDGRYIETDPGVGIPKFCCGASAWSGNPSNVNIPSTNGSCSTPGCSSSGPGFAGPLAPESTYGSVDVATGYFVYDSTDLVVPGIIPILINRYYVNRLGGSATAGTTDGLGAFGKGMAFEYDWRVDNYSNMIRLTKPGGSRFDFALQPDGTYRNFVNPEFIGARIDVVAGVRVLTSRDGWKYTFENQGGLVWFSDRNGNTVTIVRQHGMPDAGGYISKIYTAEGKEIFFNQTYTGTFIQTDSIIAPGVGGVRYEYEADPFSAYPRLKKIMSLSAETITEYDYDSQGRMNSIKDAKGNTVLSNVYDANHRIVSQTHPDGSVDTFNYTVAGGVVTQTDVTAPNGAVNTWRFNGYSYISEKADPDGTLTYQIDSGSNQITSITDSLNRTASYAYYSTSDARHGLVSSVTDPSGYVTSYEYEPVFGMPTKITDAQGKSTTIAYTFDGAKVTKKETRDALNNLTTVNYNSYGVPVSVTDPNGNTSVLTYDPADRSKLMTIADSLGNTTRYSYDPGGRVTAVTNPRGFATSYAYDLQGRIASSRKANNAVTSYEYDPNGSMKKLIDPKGNETKYEYDNQGRIIKAIDRMGRTETYAYYSGNEITATTGGNLKSYTDKRGIVTTYNAYDAMGKVKLVTFGDGSTVQYTYDAIGRLTSIADSVSGTIGYTYDALDRVTQETTPQGSISYTYDNLGRRATMTVVGQPVVNYGYDDAGRLTSISRVVGGVLRNYALGYDNTGRRSSLQIPLGEGVGNINTSYGFDGASHLLNITHVSPVGTLENFSYNYDQNGNRTRVERVGSIPLPAPMSGTSYSNEYEMLSYNGNTLTYDENGNLTSKTDSGGNVTTYTWDARNRLVGISSPTLTASFVYDALNRRIGKTINGVTISYLYDGVDIIQETSGGIKTDYIRTLNVDEPLTRVTGSSVSHYLKDGLGSIVGIADDSGALVSSISYDPYGNTTSTEPFGFTGRENDGTGFMYYRARYYSPEMLRFISRDPLQFASGSVNFYSYVQNNPTNFIDPAGLYRKDVHFGLTNTRALMIGLPPDIANQIAMADQNVDENFWTSPFNPLGGTIFHFQSSKCAAIGLEQSLASGNINEFGKFLHVMQDTYSHKGWSAPFGHAIANFGTTIPANVTDLYNSTNPRDIYMGKETEYWLNRFKNRFIK